MTLGRSTSGAIKIKTDGGLRAVSCACCGGCGCAITIPQNLRDIVANASINSITMFGFAPDEFDYESWFEEDAWQAYWFVGGYSSESSEPPHILASIAYNRTTGCLKTLEYYLEWSDDPAQSNWSIGVAEFGKGSECAGVAEEADFVEGTFTINGTGAYPYYYYTGLDLRGREYLAVPPPNLIFT